MVSRVKYWRCPKCGAVLENDMLEKGTSDRVRRSTSLERAHPVSLNTRIGSVDGVWQLWLHVGPWTLLAFRGSALRRLVMDAARSPQGACAGRAPWAPRTSDTE